ncbi:MAG: AAA family ATPase [Solirubrobacterales bacterium]|nr:AAA family ATPase [Solirubrobacterales bacterium]
MALPSSEPGEADVAPWRREWALIGRDEELALLGAVLSSDASRGAVLVGRAGSGKSRLAREVGRQRERTGGWVVRGQGTESAATIAFGAIAHLLPSTRPPGLDRLSAFQTVAARLRGHGHDRTLVVLDDAHLLDEASAALALHLAVTESADLLVCVREGEQTPDAVTALWKDDHLQRVDLQPLSDADVAGMVTSALPGRVAPDVVRWVQQRSLGLPLFAVELVRGAVSEGALGRQGDEWGFTRTPRPPQRMRELINERLGGLAPDEREGLELLAFGEPLPYHVAIEVIGEARLQALEERGLADAARPEDHACRLAHPLHGEVALAGMARGRRDAIARRLASALLEDKRRSATDVLRAVRWQVEASERVGVPELMQATRAATAVFDPSLALDYARQAHAMAGSAITAMAMAGPLMSLARFAEVEAALAPYEGHESGEDEAAMALHFRVVALQIGLRRTPDALALLDRYADAYPSDSWRRRVRDERIGVTTHAGHHLEAAGLLHEMLADRGTSQEEFRRAWSGPIALVYSGDSETACRFADRVLVNVEAPAADVTEIMAWTAARADAGLDWNRIDAALCPMLGEANRTGNVVLAEVCTFWLGSVALTRGRVVTAQNRLAAAVSLLQAQDPFALHVLTLAMLAQARAMQRDPDGARGAIAEAEAILARRPLTWVEEADLVRARVRISLAEGHPVQAQKTALAAASRAGQVIIHRGTLLHEALRAGAPASQVARGLQDVASRSDLPLIAAYANHAAASARRNGTELEGAAENFARIGALLHAAEVSAEAAAVHSAGGDRPQAVAAAERCRQFVTHCEGAWTPMLRFADAAAHNLTAREAEVAALASRGLTNAEIAERLVLSTRTVDSHMQRIYGKLGINRRQHLADILPTD